MWNWLHEDQTHFFPCFFCLFLARILAWGRQNLSWLSHSEMGRPRLQYRHTHGCGAGVFRLGRCVALRYRLVHHGYFSSCQISPRQGWGTVNTCLLVLTGFQGNSGCNCPPGCVSTPAMVWGWWAPGSFSARSKNLLCVIVLWWLKGGREQRTCSCLHLCCLTVTFSKWFVLCWSG